jgi:hypothetical protein
MKDLSKRGFRVLLIALTTLLWLVVFWLLWNTLHAIDSDPQIQLRDLSPEGPHAEEYKSIVDLVTEGNLCSENYGECELPEEHVWLSETGLIWIDRRSREHTTIFFWRSAGILGEGWGYAYRADNANPEDVIWCDEYERLEHSHWFRCVSH